MENEKRLIYANALKDLFCNACSTKNRYKRTVEKCRSNTDTSGNICFKMRLIDAAPTVDAVEVVRCKDCTYWDKAVVNEKGFLICPASGMEIKCDDFCSYGERKDDDTTTDKA